MSLISSVTYASDGYFLIGYGIKSQGIGGVGIALLQDGFAAATNPAGMALLSDRADLGVNVFSKNSSIKLNSVNINNMFFYANGTYKEVGQGYSYLPELGYIKNINQSLTAGIAIYSSGNMATQYIINQPFSNANWPLNFNYVQHHITTALSYKANEQNSFGVALNYVYQKLSEEGLNSSTTVVPSYGSITATDLVSTTNNSHGWGIRFGWAGKVTDNLTLGATWASKINTGISNNNNSVLFANGTNFNIPENYGVGMAYKFAPSWTLAADLTKIKYSEVNSAANENVYFLQNNPFGASGYGWNDVTVIKLGFSYDYTPNVTLRAGYNHSGEAIPADRTYFNILAPASVQDHLTFGGTWKVSNKGELSASYVHGFKNTVNGVNSIPGNLPASYGGGNANITNQENSFGLTYGWKF